MISPERHIAVVHGYIEHPSPFKPGLKIQKPDIKARMTLLAIGNLIQQGKIDTVILNTSCLMPQTPQELASGRAPQIVAEQMAQQLRRNHPDRNLRIIVEANASITREESESAAEIAKKYGLNPLEIIAVGAKPHRRRIRRSTDDAFGKGKVMVASIEDLVYMSSFTGKNFLATIVSQYQESSQYTWMQQKEFILNIIDALPFGNVFIKLLNRIQGDNKTLALGVQKFAQRLIGA